ncbi:YceD family protein [Fundicoccus sp. Sow4_D5]|uniref:YceD family protein n=1 Tax=unclassified Fundicoccus TaxID=2761543 RepID=UPI003F902913
MKWTIRQIQEHKGDLLNFDVQLSVFDQVKLRDDSVIHLDPVRVVGYFVPYDQDIVLHCELTTVITLPSSRSLKPVRVELSVPISERYILPGQAYNAEDYEETAIELEFDYIDLDAAVVDVVLLNIPVRVIAPDEEEGAMPSGNNWTVVTEEAYNAQKVEEQVESVDPRFEALKTLKLKDDE